MKRNFKGLIKLASPWLRRLSRMPPDKLRRIPMTDNLLLMLRNPQDVELGQFSNAIPRISNDKKFRVRSLVEQNIPSKRQDSAFVLREIKDNLQTGFGHWGKPVTNLYDLINYQRNISSQLALDKVNSHLKPVIEKARELKSEKKSIPDLIASSKIGDPLSYDEFIKRHPQAESLYKGGVFSPESWEIEDPAWMSGRVGVASAYSLNPTSNTLSHRMLSLVPPTLTVANRSSSPSLSSGRTFFTGHVGEAKRSTRLMRMLKHKYWHDSPTIADQFPDYEVVIPGNEVSKIPYRYYTLVHGENNLTRPVISGDNIRAIRDELKSPGQLGIKFQEHTPNVANLANIAKRIGKRKYELYLARNDLEHTILDNTRFLDPFYSPRVLEGLLRYM